MTKGLQAQRTPLQRLCPQCIVKAVSWVGSYLKYFSSKVCKWIADFIWARQFIRQCRRLRRLFILRKTTGINKYKKKYIVLHFLYFYNSESQNYIRVPTYLHLHFLASFASPSKRLQVKFIILPQKVLRYMLSNMNLSKITRILMKL